MSYQDLAIKHYSNFVLSSEWIEIMNSSDASEEIKDIISEFGIGVNLNDDGSFNYESGVLFDDIPKSKRDLVVDDEAGNSLMYDLAEGLVNFLKKLV